MDHDARRERLNCVLADARLGLDVDAVALSGYSNDTWRVGSLVVRVCWRGDVKRMEREASIAAHLPPQVLYPPLVAAGRTGDLAWMVTRWVEGVPLAEAWPRLDRRDRQHAVAQLAQVLEALHGWKPPAPLTGFRDGREVVDLSDVGAVVGATLNPLPVDRAFALVAHARTMPFVDPRVLDAVAQRLQDLSAHDPYGSTGQSSEQVLVHGDAHLTNVLWNEGGLVGLLDLEWARLGPRELELEPFLRAVDWSGREPELMPAHEMADLLSWMAYGYPRLFASPHLIQRLWLFQLTFTLRELFTWPAATASADRLAPDHPLNLLPMFARSSDHLEQLLAGAIEVSSRRLRAS